MSSIYLRHCFLFSSSSLHAYLSLPQSLLFFSLLSHISCASFINIILLFSSSETSFYPILTYPIFSFYPTSLLLPSTVFFSVPSSLLPLILAFRFPSLPLLQPPFASLHLPSLRSSHLPPLRQGKASSPRGDYRCCCVVAVVLIRPKVLTSLTARRSGEKEG